MQSSFQLYGLDSHFLLNCFKRKCSAFWLQLSQTKSYFFFFRKNQVLIETINAGVFFGFGLEFGYNMSSLIRCFKIKFLIISFLLPKANDYNVFKFP